MIRRTRSVPLEKVSCSTRTSGSYWSKIAAILARHRACLRAPRVSFTPQSSGESELSNRTNAKPRVFRYTASTHAYFCEPFIGRERRAACLSALTADSDEAGHAFQIEAGHPFRFEAGHRSDLKWATWRHSGGSRRCCSCFSIWVKRAKHGAERAGSSGTARGRPGSQQEGPARDAACPCS